MGEPRELAESALSVARFTILRCKMMPHLDRVLPAPILRLNSCHLILQFQVTLWLTSGVQGMLSSWNLPWPVSTTFQSGTWPFQFLKSSQAMAGGGK